MLSMTTRRALTLTLFLGLSSTVGHSQAPLKPPATRQDSTVDNYFGTRVVDPYRWLEDQKSPEVARWVDAENKVTFDYLAGIPIRERFRRELTNLINVPRVSTPFRVAGKLYFSKNSGLQNQSVAVEQASLNGAVRQLIDPKKLSPDGSTELAGYVPSPDGTYLAYSLSVGGSDWSEVHIRTLSNMRELTDTVHWVKYSGTAWTNDGRGFFYTRYPTPAKDSVLTAKAINGKIYYHRVGTPDSQDRLIYERSDRPDWFLGANVTEDGRFLSITMNHGTEPKNLLYVADMKDGRHPEIGAPLVPVYTGNDAEYYPLGNNGDTIVMQTTANAPKRKVVSFRLSDTSRAHWHTVVPEGNDVLEASTMAGHRVITQTLEDVKSRLRMFSSDGRTMSDIVLPSIGTVARLSSRNDTPELFYSFSSFLTPSTVYRYDFKTGKSTAFQPPRVPFDPSPFETKQAFYTSKDGTKVPMFITAKKGLILDGSHPTVRYAYGGFNISNTPGFSTSVVVWLEHGGVLRRSQHSRRRRVWRRLAPCRDARQEAECLRRLHRRGRIPRRTEIHLALAPRDSGLFEWRAPHRSGRGAAPRIVRGGVSRRRRHGHAPLRQVQRGRCLGNGIRVIERQRPVPDDLQVLAGAQRQGWDVLPGYDRDHG
jgi:prolyl oligopeptidase